MQMLVMLLFATANQNPEKFCFFTTSYVSHATYEVLKLKRRPCADGHFPHHLFCKRGVRVRLQPRIGEKSYFKDFEVRTKGMFMEVSYRM